MAQEVDADDVEMGSELLSDLLPPVQGGREPVKQDDRPSRTRAILAHLEVPAREVDDPSDVGLRVLRLVVRDDRVQRQQSRNDDDKCEDDSAHA